MSVCSPKSREHLEQRWLRGESTRPNQCCPGSIPAWSHVCGLNLLCVLAFLFATVVLLILQFSSFPTPGKPMFIKKTQFHVYATPTRKPAKSDVVSSLNSVIMFLTFNSCKRSSTIVALYPKRMKHFLYCPE